MVTQEEVNKYMDSLDRLTIETYYIRSLIQNRFNISVKEADKLYQSWLSENSSKYKI